MDTTHLHLLLNHFPIIGTLIGTVLLLYGIWKKNISIQQISLATIFVMALIAIPVFLTGEPAEDKIENLPGVVESIIEQHEEMAEIALWTMLAAGLISGITIALQLLNNKMAKSFVMISMLISLVSFGLMARTGYLGGQIRHTEIRANATVNVVNQSGGVEDED